MCVASSFMDGEDALKLTLTIVTIAVVVIILTLVLTRSLHSSTDNKRVTGETEIYEITKEDTDTTEDNITEIDLGDRKILIIEDKAGK